VPEQPGLLDGMPVLPLEVSGPEPPKRGVGTKYHAAKVNPMLRVYGAGPEGAKCGSCAHLRVKELAGRYFKCALRGDTNGPGTDHRVRWPACSKFEERQEEPDSG
jgi:hypothetical protein